MGKKDSFFIGLFALVLMYFLSFPLVLRTAAQIPKPVQGVIGVFYIPAIIATQVFPAYREFSGFTD